MPAKKGIKLTDKGKNQKEKIFIILMTEPMGLNSPNDYTVNFKIHHRLMGAKKGSSTQGGIALGDTGNNEKEVALVAPKGKHNGMIFVTGIDITIRNLNDVPDDTIKITKLIFGFEAPDTRQDGDMVEYPVDIPGVPLPMSGILLTTGLIGLAASRRVKPGLFKRSCQDCRATR
ncbi:hypothetical protein [Fluviibacterium sp. S390]|uniref:hypothetical protein n=1 Tax=Fluviibacterium sp. S390 TaxID=3415139 RepID=UPI003C799B4A